MWTPSPAETAIFLARVAMGSSGLGSTAASAALGGRDVASRDLKNRRGVGFTRTAGRNSETYCSVFWRRITLRYFLKSAGFKRRRWGYGLRTQQGTIQARAALLVIALVFENVCVGSIFGLRRLP
jgi:hypothetical protein